MKPAPFTYHRPTTLDAAVRLLAELAPQDGRVLAGGQSLIDRLVAVDQMFHQSTWDS